MFLALLFSVFSLQSQSDDLHPWTDSQGRTLQASFVSLDGDKVKIKWNGQVVPIPLASLSPESQNLAKQLAAKMSSTPPQTRTKLPSRLDGCARRICRHDLFHFCRNRNDRVEWTDGSPANEQLISPISGFQSTCF